MAPMYREIDFTPSLIAGICWLCSAKDVIEELCADGSLRGKCPAICTFKILPNIAEWRKTASRIPNSNPGGGPSPAPIPPTTECVQGLFPRGEGGAEYSGRRREIDHSLPSSAEVRNGWSCTCTSPIRLLGRDRCVSIHIYIYIYIYICTGMT